MLLSFLLSFGTVSSAFAMSWGSVNCNPGQIVYTVTLPDIKKISSMTVINGQLYVVPYVAESSPRIEMATGIIYNISEDGILELSPNQFLIDTGHVNSIDYNADNDCLLVGNGGKSTSIEPNCIYIFKNASTYRNYVMANKNLMTIDVSKNDWGKQLNCMWINADLICCITNYEQNKMDAYAVHNPNQIGGNSRGFIRIVQLGRGHANLGSGKMISNASENEFNGTYRELKVFERPYDNSRANNDCMWYNNKIWERWTSISTFGFDIYITELFDKDSTVDISEITIPYIAPDGKPLSAEGEGICYYNGYIFIAAKNIVAVVRAWT